MASEHNPEKGPRTLSCEAWEALLVDALDGTLEARDSEAFTAHSRSCAGCGELLEEAQQGSEWLRFLRQTPEAPEGLVERILAGTTGPLESQPLMAAGIAALPQQPWGGVSIALLQRHVAESRILMTLAMAFFSIALTLNLSGVRLNQLKLSDLKPSTLASSVSHQYFTTSAHVMRYYANLRFVYEVESRWNEIRQDDKPAQGQPQPVQSQPQPQPRSSGKPGGSARKGGAPKPVPAPRRNEAPIPVLAGYFVHRRTAHLPSCERVASADYSSNTNPGNTSKTSERSLV